ncbi:MAG TPA: apolipoprotein N-acyltransferase [Pseudonocardiaceae bacterium]|nr:apolipoprotein N-acyltransferase [Pseudonocardiaceae bacterium]
MAAPTLRPADVAGQPERPAQQADRGRRRRRPHLPTLPTAARLVVALAGGIALYASFPPRTVWWLAPIGFAMLGIVLYGRRARAGFGYGFVWSMGFMIPLMYWTGSFVGVVAPWVLCSFEALIMALGTAAIAAVSRLRGAPLWGALLWIADEALRARVPFGGLPWGKVAFGQADGSYLSLAALGGTPLVGFAVALTGFGLAALVLVLWRKENRRTAMIVGPVLAILVPLVAGIAAWPLVGTDPNAGTATVAAIQGNVPRLGLDFDTQRRIVLDYHTRETEALAAQVRAGKVAQPQLVIWPENSDDVDPYVNPDAYAELSEAASDIHAPMEVGAVVYSQGPQPKNTAILWEPGKGPVLQYVKRKLMPFGETMPWRSFFAYFDPIANTAGNFAPGDRAVPFPMGPAKVGIDTCYEVAFDDVVRDSVTDGTNLIAVPTNNATFGKTEMTYQQLAMDQERAVEHGRSVVVAATSGVSAIIEPNGTITQQTELFTPAALVATVPLRSTVTLADRLGSWPEWVMVVVGLLALVFGVRSNMRRAGMRRGAAALAAAKAADTGTAN